MANTLKLRRSAVASAVPTTGQLALGELAMNTADGKLFMKTDDGAGTTAIVEIGASVLPPGANAVKFDDISSSFDGVTTNFSLTVNSYAQAPAYQNATIISIGGVIQEAGTAYTISGSTISFTSAPAAGLDFFGIDLASPVLIGTPNDNTVTSAKIVNGTIVNDDINATAEIAVSKLADGDARQLLQTDAAGTGVEWASNIDIPGTLDVSGVATFDGNVTLEGDLTLNAQSDLRFADGDSSNWVSFQAPATIASNVTWTLPASDGTADQVLTTDGLGTLSWQTPSAGVSLGLVLALS